MKKGIIVLVLALFVAGGVFAQEEKSANAKSNWISGEVGFIVAGARYEHMLNENWSIGANAYWSNVFLFWNELEVGASARFYPWGKTFFAGLGLGFHTHTVALSGIAGVAISPEVGWKIDVGNVGGFFLSPGIKLPITLGVREDFSGDNESEFGVNVGVVLYLGLGYAF